ncbi:MAG TPA: DUF2281 domain-containing protein [Saprospiraceae bacterium]|nr:DUF2281 domain-containing protein [Saprospiraceae bacterium]HMQ83529.1 DUF2281 domain-containing protein [Saprospiraceae bacterium]
MNEHQILYQIQQLPEHIKQEVLDFVAFLFNKYKGKMPNSPKIENSNTGSKPSFGCGAILVKIASDFDEPLEDFKDYTE